MSTSDKPVVKCDWANRNIVHIDPDGQVHPCCYFANIYWREKYDGGGDLDWMIPQYKEYIEREKEFNVENRSVVDIIKEPFFNETLEKNQESWDTIPLQCKKHCSQWEDPTGQTTPLGSFGKQHDGGEAVGWKKNKDDQDQQEANITEHWNEADPW